MTHSAAALLVGLVTTYLVIGIGFAVPFVLRGIDAVDPMAIGAPWTFRLLVFPGAALLWPLLLLRWAAGATTPPVESNAHRRAARRPS